MYRPHVSRSDISRRPDGRPLDCGRIRYGGAPSQHGRCAARWLSQAGRSLRVSVSTFVLAAFAACGLADDERDVKDRYVYVSLSDASFASFCLEKFDTDGDGRLSRYEARCVADIDCSGRGIASLDDLSVFENLRTLDCSYNKLMTLDIRRLLDTHRAVLFAQPAATHRLGSRIVVAPAGCVRERLPDARSAKMLPRVAGRSDRQSVTRDGLLPHFAGGVGEWPDRDSAGLILLFPFFDSEPCPFRSVGCGNRAERIVAATRNLRVSRCSRGRSRDAYAFRGAFGDARSGFLGPKWWILLFFSYL